MFRVVLSDEIQRRITERTVCATSKFENPLKISVEVISNVLKYVLKCFCLRSETTSKIHWDIDGLRSSVPHKVYEHNNRPPSQSDDTSSPKSSKTKNVDRFFWDEHVCIVSDAHSPISTAGIDEVKCLSIIFIHVIFILFFLPPPNIRFLQGETIPPTKRRAARPIGICYFCSPGLSCPAMKITITLRGNSLQHNVVRIGN
jgi:hypothetical protein